MRDSRPSTAAPRRKSEWFGVVGLVGMAVLLLWLGYTTPPALKVPDYVAYLLSVTLLLSAFALAAKLSGRSAANHGFIAMLLLGFAGTGAWIAIPGSGAQRARIVMAEADPSRPGREVSPTICRTVFGTGAIITLLVAGYAFTLWRGERGRSA